MKRLLLTYGFMISFALPINAEAQQLLGCDDLERANEIVDARKQLEFEAAKQMISQPISAEQGTCLDQHLAAVNSVSEQATGNPSGALANNVQAPFVQQMNDMFDNMVNIGGTIQEQINNISSDLMSSLGDLGGGGLAAALSGGNGGNVCDVTEQAWLINQCIEMPQIPSLSQVLEGQISELSGVAGAVLNPDRYIEQVCENANDTLGGYVADLGGAFDNAAENSLSPITDTLQNAGDAADNTINSPFN